MTISDIIREIESFDEREFVGPVSDGEISTASKEIGLPFSGEYVAFLKALGAGSVSSESFIGLGGPSHLSVVWLTKTLREKQGSRRFPKTLIPVRSDGFGNYDCIDTMDATSDGEFAIVEWVHDASSEAKNKILSRSYFGWFVSVLKMLREL